MTQVQFSSKSLYLVTLVQHYEADTVTWKIDRKFYVSGMVDAVEAGSAAASYARRQGAGHEGYLWSESPEQVQVLSVQPVASVDVASGGAVVLLVDSGEGGR